MLLPTYSVYSIDIWSGDCELEASGMTFQEAESMARYLNQLYNVTIDEEAHQIYIEEDEIDA